MHRSEFNMFSKLRFTCVTKFKNKLYLTLKTLRTRCEMSITSKFELAVSLLAFAACGWAQVQVY